MKGINNIRIPLFGWIVCLLPCTAWNSEVAMARANAFTSNRSHSSLNTSSNHRVDIYPMEVVLNIGTVEVDMLTSACNGTPDSTTIDGPSVLCSGANTLLSLSTLYSDADITYQWASSAISGGPYTNLGNSSDQLTGALANTTYYVCVITCANSSLFFITPEKMVTVYSLPLVSVSPSTGNYCIPGGSPVSLTASNASSYVWMPANGLSATSGSAVTASPSTSTIYTVVGTDTNGCSNSVTNIAVNVYQIPVVTAPNVSACSGTVNLGGSPSGGIWNLPNPYAGAATSYTYFYTDSNGCSNLASASISAFAANISGVNVTNITGVSASVNYAAVGGIGWYEVRWKPVSSSTWIVGTNNNSTTKAITNLSANTAYEVQVRGFCTTSTPGAWSNSTLFSTNSSCGTPTGLGIINIGNTSGTATWTMVASAGYYSVQYKVSTTTTWLVLTSNGSSLLLPNLQTNSQYDVRIATVCGTTYSAYSSIINFTTGTGCGIPTGLNVTNLTPTSAKLNWTAVTGASYYSVRYKKTSVSTWTSSTTTGVSKSISGITAGTLYEFQVQTVCTSTSTSAWSASTNFSTPASKVNPTSLEEDDENLPVRIYPNPTHDLLYTDIMLDENRILEMKMIDLSGRLVKDISLMGVKGDNHIVLDLSDLNDGLYSVQITMNDGRKWIMRVRKG